MTRQRRLGPLNRKKGAWRRASPALLALPAAALLIAGWFLFEFEKPAFEAGRDIDRLGGRMELPIRASDRKSGLSLVNISLRQGEKTATLFEKRFPREAWFGQAGPRELGETVEIKAKEAGFREGPAELLVTVRDQSLAGFFKGNKTAQAIAVNIDTTPPVVTLASTRRFIQPGGSACVTYTVSEQPERHGVLVGDAFFPGFPAAKEGSYVAYFALPWDAKEVGATAVVARDAAGNEARADFSTGFRPRKEKRDTINLSDGFFERKLPEFRQHYPNLAGEPLEQYLYVNREVRAQNAKRILEICAKPEPEQLWKDRFVPMPGARRAGFADQRSYMYQGRKVDEQTHLGMDIASTAQAEVRAANRGKAVLAEYMGIYGNTVILDHGQGLFSLYSHLSSIEARPGALVEQGALIGRSGMTGMAGGDHLHFSMLVHGIFVTPIEWWDQHWIDINIKDAQNGR